MILFGNAYSVYARTIRMALYVKSVDYVLEHVDPFDLEDQEAVCKVHPFARVPVLRADAFEIYETQAILDYIEAIFPAPGLVPRDAKSAARMRQVMSIADSYVYWPLVRQAASQHVFNPLFGEPRDEAEFAQGLLAAPRVLDALEALAAEGQVLIPGQMTMAECHLWPMMTYALMVPELADLVHQRAHLTDWADATAQSAAAEATMPDMEALKDHG